MFFAASPEVTSLGWVAPSDDDAGKSQVAPTKTSVVV